MQKLNNASAQKRLTIKLIVAAVVILAAAMLLYLFYPQTKQAQQAADIKYTDSLLAMDTYMTFTVYGDNAEKATNEVKALITDCEKSWSVTDENSEISRLNRTGEAVLSLRTKDLLEKAKAYCRYTDGHFDPTIYPLVRAWGFTTGEYRVPASDELEELKKLTGADKLILLDDKAILSEGSMVDLGGVAKGYVGDLAMQTLKQNGIKSALISLGGNVQTLGVKPDGKNWIVGIRSPYDNGLIGKISIGEGCVITSGAYERHFTAEDGTLYGHIISPFTGKPAANGLVSVTIVADTGSKADALSTALFVMGTEEAIRFWKENAGFEVIMLSDDGTLFVSEGIYASFEPLDSKDVKTICEIKR